MKKVSGAKLQLKRVSIESLTSATGGAEGGDTGGGTSDGKRSQNVEGGMCVGQCLSADCTVGGTVVVKADAKS